MIQRLKKAKENKKGFTLVELIVVLVILAILIALLVPSLTGYIDKARQKSILTEARNVQMAAQTYGSEQYDKLQSAGSASIPDVTLTGSKAGTPDEISKLAETSGTGTVKFDTKGKVSEITYKNKGWKVTYTEATGWGEVSPE